MLQDDILAYLKDNSDILNSPSSDRVFVDTWLPNKYPRSSGAAIVFRPRGGAGQDNFIIESVIYEFRAFAPPDPGSNKTESVFLVAEAIFKAMQAIANNPQSGQSWHPRVITGTDLVQEDGGWYVVNQQFQISQVRC